MIATIVDVDALWQTIWTAAAAGIGISVVFAVTVLGATRSADERREGRAALAALYVAVAVVGSLASLGAIAFGIVLITSK